MTVLETIVCGNGVTVTIETDDDAEHPRDFGESFGILKLTSVNPRYARTRDEDPGVAEDDEAHLLVLPVYTMCHGAVGYSLTDYGCRWDSWRAGVIIATRARAISMLGIAAADLGSEATTARVRACLEAEITDLDNWAQGLVCGYVATSRDTATGKIIDEDSCWGFYGGVKDAREEGVAAAGRLRAQLELKWEANHGR